MRVQFWGTRGSIPTPGPNTIQFGGNTSCVEVRTNAGTLLVLDCGTGLRELGRALLKQGSSPIIGHLFISHTHWDHIQGFPFFGPLLLPNNHFTIYGAHQLHSSLEATMAGQMESVYFPVRLGQLAANIAFREVDGQSLTIDDAVLQFQPLNHTTICMGYRIEADGASVVYMTDTEPYDSFDHGFSGSVQDSSAPKTSGALLSDQRVARLTAFATGADLLIMDAQYTLEEYLAKRGWGHSHLDYVVDFALAAGVKRLALFHHDPDHSDEVIESFEVYCRNRAQQDGREVQVFAAREGASLTL